MRTTGHRRGHTGVLRPTIALIAALTTGLISAPSVGAQSELQQAPTLWFGNGVWFESDGCCTTSSISYGTAGDVPLQPGNITLGGLGLWRPSDQTFRFDADSDGVTDLARRYGAATDVPLVGHVGPYTTFSPANDIVDGVAVWRPSDGIFRFDVNVDGRTDVTVRYGQAGDIPFMAYRLEFTASGGITVSRGFGIYRPSDTTVRIDLNRDGRSDVVRPLDPGLVEQTATATFVAVLPVVVGG